jgi:hypothetical protein
MILRIIILSSILNFSKFYTQKAQVTQLVEYNIEAVVVVSSTLTLGNEYAEMADRFRLGRNGVKTV